MECCHWRHPLHYYPVRVAWRLRSEQQAVRCGLPVTDSVPRTLEQVIRCEKTSRHRFGLERFSTRGPTTPTEPCPKNDDGRHGDHLFRPKYSVNGDGKRRAGSGSRKRTGPPATASPRDGIHAGARSRRCGRTRSSAALPPAAAIPTSNAERSQPFPAPLPGRQQTEPAQQGPGYYTHARWQQQPGGVKRERNSVRSLLCGGIGPRYSALVCSRLQAIVFRKRFESL
jgi:hypothetical protein